MGRQINTRPSMENRSAARIITVNPSTRTIEAGIRDGAVKVVVKAAGPLFRWPRQGELWVLKRVGTSWELDFKLEENGIETQPIENLSSGESKISSDVIYTETSQVRTEADHSRWFQTGTTLPSSPVDGDVYIYNLTGGVKWMLQYNSSGSSGKKWEFIGGSPLIASDDDIRSLTNQTTYASLPTDPISTTIPLAGDYDIEIQAGCILGAMGSGTISYTVGATAANDNWAANFAGSSALSLASVVKKTRHTGIAASATIAEKAKTGGNYEILWQLRRIIITPVRVG